MKTCGAFIEISINFRFNYIFLAFKPLQTNFHQETHKSLSTFWLVFSHIYCHFSLWAFPILHLWPFPQLLGVPLRKHQKQSKLHIWFMDSTRNKHNRAHVITALKTLAAAATTHICHCRWLANQLY